MDHHPLKTLLQLHLASDGSAVLHLPYVLSSLTSESLESSPHLQKWTSRVNSLIQSKDSAARWAGLCVALRTAVLSQALMLECAQSWVVAGLSFISKNDRIPVMKACIRLLRHIFTSASRVSEFQRQICLPNVPKFSAALSTLAAKTYEVDLRILALDTLTHLVATHPTLHRATHTTLSNLALRNLNGSAPSPTVDSFVQASSRLYSVLHHTGGKVGAAQLWRKSVDDTLQFAWGAFCSLRTTYGKTNNNITSNSHATPTDPIVAIPLHLDRLKAAVIVLNDLLQTYNARPIVVPIGPLARLCSDLLACTTDGQAEGHIDSTIHLLEASIVPNIWSLACTLVETLASCTRHSLTPHLSQLCLRVTILLEQKLPPVSRGALLRALTKLLVHCPVPRDDVLTSRLARAVLPTLASLMSPKPEAVHEHTGNASTTSVVNTKNRKGKKRARDYEGDEIFNATQNMFCPTEQEGEVLLSALDVLSHLLRNVSLPPATQSLSGRVILALYTSLPHISPEHLSPDHTLHGRLYQALQRASGTLASGSTGILSKSLGITIMSSLQAPSSHELWRDIDLMIHPRLPPLMRVLPHVEALSLFRAEEGEEESDIRQSLGVVTLDEPEQRQPASTHSTELNPPSDTVFQMTPTPTFAPSIPAQPPHLPTTLTRAINVPSALEPPKTVQSISTPNSHDGPGSLAPSSPHNEAPSSSSQPAQHRAASLQSRPVPVDEDEDEPMPGIDMDSDSD